MNVKRLVLGILLMSTLICGPASARSDELPPAGGSAWNLGYFFGLDRRMQIRGEDFFGHDHAWDQCQEVAHLLSIELPEQPALEDPNRLIIISILDVTAIARQLELQYDRKISASFLTSFYLQMIMAVEGDDETAETLRQSLVDEAEYWGDESGESPHSLQALIHDALNPLSHIPL